MKIATISLCMVFMSILLFVIALALDSGALFIPAVHLVGIAFGLTLYELLED